MRQGTTPTNTITLPFQIPYGAQVRIVYAQGVPGESRVVFVKTGKEVTVEGNTVSATLSQQETFCLDPRQRVLIHVRVRMPDGSVPDLTPLSVTVEECVDKYVMTGGN